ncbi:hypothetical protein NC651_003599 [Populus alba x Populus x berolinensis]|nr:hypothetical protein NC651_003599 [Populus alba x Populus x berolinensis]
MMVDVSNTLYLPKLFLVKKIRMENASRGHFHLLNCYPFQVPASSTVA